MNRLLALTLAADLLGGGCASCGEDLPGGDLHDSDVEADVEDAEGSDAPDADRDAEPDVELPEGAEPMRITEVPHDRAGLDCGRGCRQISFGESVRRFRYDVSERYVVYEGGDGSSASPYLIDSQSDSEYRLMRCRLREDPLNCTAPAVYGEHIVFSTRPWEVDLEWTIWRYRIGDAFRTQIAIRTMTNRNSPTSLFDLYQETLAFWDSVDHPPGIYALDLDGGVASRISPLGTCCVGDPHVYSRQVVYDADFPSQDVWLVDIDTLERRNLTDDAAAQWYSAFDGQWVVWTDGRNDPNPVESHWEQFNPDIYGVRLPDGNPEPLCTNSAAQTGADVHSGLVAWADFRNAENPNEVDFNADTDIYLLDLETRQEVRVTDLPGPQLFPRLWGRRLFYLGLDRRDQMAIFMVDLDEAGLLEGGAR